EQSHHHHQPQHVADRESEHSYCRSLGWPRPVCLRPPECCMRAKAAWIAIARDMTKPKTGNISTKTIISVRRRYRIFLYSLSLFPFFLNKFNLNLKGVCLGLELCKSILPGTCNKLFGNPQKAVRCLLVFFDCLDSFLSFIKIIQISFERLSLGVKH